LPFVMVLIFVIILNGHMMTKLGYYFPWYFLGGAFELIAGVLMCKRINVIRTLRHKLKGIQIPSQRLLRLLQFMDTLF